MFRKKTVKDKPKSNVVGAPMAEEYFAAGMFWEDDLFKRNRRSKTIAWTVAGVAVIGALLSLVAVASLAPLKTVVPYIIEVDRLTGETKVQRHIDESPIPQKEAIDKYFIHKYLQARAGYNRNDFNERYRIVTLMSDNQVALDYSSTVNPNNDEGPVKRYGDLGFAKVEVREINFIAENTALVRFSIRERLATQEAFTKEGNATISYYYNQSPKDEETRLVTPLGFMVRGYRVDPVLAESGVFK